MSDEQSRPQFNKPSPIPKNVDWQSLMRLDGEELETHYRDVLESLGKQKGMLGGSIIGLQACREYIPDGIIRGSSEFRRRNCPSARLIDEALPTKPA